MSVETDLQEMLDYHQVSQTLYRYASSIDSKDFATLRSLFVDDATARYSDRASLEGADEIVRWIDGATSQRGWQHHLLSVYQVEVTGDEAEALTYHTSHQTNLSDPDTVRLIVARYRDRLRKVDAKWKIVRKEMDIGWREERTLPDTTQGRA